MIAGINVIFFYPSQATVEALKKQIADKMVSILCKNLAIKIISCYFGLFNSRKQGRVVSK